MMARYFLTSLAIEGFRGVNNENEPLDITFEPNSVNSVFAVNGIGKSSIFEALCYAIHGTIPKLESLHPQERPQDYYCNRFHSKNAASIVVEFQPDYSDRRKRSTSASSATEKCSCRCRHLPMTPTRSARRNASLSLVRHEGQDPG